MLFFGKIILAATVSGTHIACYAERSPYARLLYQDYAHFRGSLTPELCIKHCKNKGYAYAGVQFAFECFCSKFRPSFRYIIEEKDCDSRCEGNNAQICGGGSRMNVYEVVDVQKNPVEKNYAGCVNSTEKKLLVQKSRIFNDKLTPELCVAFCYRGGFMFAGLTSGECLCGDTDMDKIKKLQVGDDECDTKCGNDRFTCGGHFRTSMYTTGITGYKPQRALGCYQDNQERIISGYYISFFERNTPKLCYNYCRGFGYKYSGVQIGHECYCGNIKPKTSLRRREDDCSITCRGDPTQNCGGAWRILVNAIEEGEYNVDPGYLGCYQEGVAVSTLDGPSITYRDTNSPKSCIEHCRVGGFKYAGLLESTQCVCGNEPPSDIYIRKEFECAMECPGDPTKGCGGLNRMIVFAIEGN